MIKYRKMTVGDIPAGLMLCRSAGWNQLSRDWELFLKLSPDGCLVATDEGKVVGTVTTIRYEDHFAWIGMVLVDPEKQRQGIGMKLLKESMDILKDEKTIKLDATPSGREVYLKLDFIDEYKISRMHISEVDTTRLSASHARPVLENDLPRIFEFDKDVFGADRRAVLE